MDSGTMKRKNKVLKGPIDLTGIYKVEILDECLVDKRPLSKIILPLLFAKYAG